MDLKNPSRAPRRGGGMQVYVSAGLITYPKEEFLNNQLSLINT